MSVWHVASCSHVFQDIRVGFGLDRCQRLGTNLVRVQLLTEFRVIVSTKDFLEIVSLVVVKLTFLSLVVEILPATDGVVQACSLTLGSLSIASDLGFVESFNRTIEVGLSAKPCAKRLLFFKLGLLSSLLVAWACVLVRTRNFQRLVHLRLLAATFHFLAKLLRAGKPLRLNAKMRRLNRVTILCICCLLLVELGFILTTLRLDIELFTLRLLFIGSNERLRLSLLNTFALLKASFALLLQGLRTSCSSRQLISSRLWISSYGWH